VTLEGNNNLLERTQRTNKDSDAMVEVDFADISLRVRLQPGNMSEHGCSCDSDFILEAMNQVGKKLQLIWKNRAVVIYLVMDIAGCHVTNDVVQRYTEILKRDYNVEIVHQVPRSHHVPTCLT